jgi:hypothetical protein
MRRIAQNSAAEACILGPVLTVLFKDDPSFRRMAMRECSSQTLSGEETTFGTSMSLEET